MNNQSVQAKRQLTIAELCEALECGLIPARMENGDYIISHRDLTQLTRPNAVVMPLPKKPALSVVVKAS
ncbi:MAG: hypothetical protein ACJ78Q_03635 [Chloroflexia bacterium]